MFTKRLSARAKQARERENKQGRSDATPSGGGDISQRPGVDRFPSNVVRTPPLKPFVRPLTPVSAEDRPAMPAPQRPVEAHREPRRPTSLAPAPGRPGGPHQMPDRPLPPRPAAILAQPAVARPMAAVGIPPTPPRPATWPITRASAMPGQPPPAAQSLGRVLAVGRDIRLTGEIRTCDTLSIEGSVEGELSETRHLEVGQGGRFNGSAEVDSATIAGAFEGDLTVRGLLTLTGSGRVSGSIRYGEIAIERGGRISGTFGLMAGGDDAVALAGPRPA